MKGGDALASEERSEHDQHFDRRKRMYLELMDDYKSALDTMVKENNDLLKEMMVKYEVTIVQAMKKHTELVEQIIAKSNLGVKQER